MLRCTNFRVGLNQIEAVSHKGLKNEQARTPASTTNFPRIGTKKTHWKVAR